MAQKLHLWIPAFAIHTLRCEYLHLQYLERPRNQQLLDKLQKDILRHA